MLINIERSQNEYAATILSVAALAYITIFMAENAVDELEEKHPKAIRHNVKKAVNEIPNDVRKLYASVNANLIGDKEAAWMADFSNTMYGKIEPQVKKLHYAVANYLGRFPEIKDRHVTASMVIVQFLASEAGSYTGHAARKFSRYYITGKDGCQESVQAVINSMSCASLLHHIVVIVDHLLAPCMPGIMDIMGDPSVCCGCKAVINCLINPDIWAEARDKSDEFNNMA